MVLVAGPAGGATYDFLVSDIDATASSIDLPGLGPTGEVAITRSSDIGPMGYLDQSVGEGRIYWPVTLNAPGLAGAGVADLEVTMVGRFFCSAHDNKIICFDMGYINDPTLGQLAVANNNKVDAGGGGGGANVQMMLTGTPPISVAGEFVDITTALYESLEKDTLRATMDLARQDLYDLNPGMPVISDAMLDTLKAMYDSDPQRELIIMPLGSGLYLSSQLSGAETMLVTPEPATLFVMMAAGLPALLKRRRSRS